MNEIKQVIILAAGRSRRMEHLSKNEPKCMFKYNDERIIERLVRQIKENGVKKIVITIGYKANLLRKIFENDDCVELVENKLYEEDINIYSMKLALEKIDGPCVIFEADTIMEDSLVKYVLGSDFENKSVWFTKGKFRNPQYGGILKSDKYGKITDIRIIPTYQEKYSGYSKLSGLMRVSANEIDLFKQLINKYSQSTIKQYFLTPWIENLKLLPCEEADISHFVFFTFNKPDEYYQMINNKIDNLKKCPEYEFVDVEKLKEIEDHDEKRAEELKDKIITEDVWTYPLIVEKKYFCVLDGHHRLQVAKKLKLKRVPAILVDYNDIDVWSLRKEYKINQNAVYKKVINNNEIYPYKTVKHKYPFKVSNIRVSLEELK